MLCALLYSQDCQSPRACNLQLQLQGSPALADGSVQRCDMQIMDSLKSKYQIWYLEEEAVSI